MGCPVMRDLDHHLALVEKKEAVLNAREQDLIEKIEEGDPETIESLMDCFWNAEGGFKAEIERGWIKEALAALKGQSVDPAFIDSRHVLYGWKEKQINR